jgi:prephenate dehydrogenase
MGERAMRVAVIGPGLIGRSVSLAATRADAAIRIVEIDAGDSYDAARGADLIVLATPIDVVLDIIRDHADLLRETVVVDTGSTKRAIIAAARGAGLHLFIGGHPMAGAASAGRAAARADLFDGRPWFLCDAGSRPDAVDVVQRFVVHLGAQPVRLHDDGSEHDRVMAAVSHLPQVVASALMVIAAERAGPRLAWAGSGLRDTTRLAQSSASVWHSILQTNADEIAPLLRELANQLTAVATELDHGQPVTELFDRANRARALL